MQPLTLGGDPRREPRQRLRDRRRADPRRRRSRFLRLGRDRAPARWPDARLLVRAARRRHARPTSVRVASLVLLAGSYLLHGKVNIANLNFSAIGSTFVPCSIRLAGTTTNIDQTWMIVEQARTGTGASNASISLQGPVTIPESTGKAEVELLCASLPRTLGPTTNVVARYRQLAAIQVDTLQVG